MSILKKLFIFMIIICISLINLQSVLGLEVLELTLYSKEEETILSNAKVTITDIDSSQSYYFDSGVNGNI